MDTAAHCFRRARDVTTTPSGDSVSSIARDKNSSCIHHLTVNGVNLSRAERTAQQGNSPIHSDSRTSSH
jgi:hypothetical protein